MEYAEESKTALGFKMERQLLKGRIKSRGGVIILIIFWINAPLPLEKKLSRFRRLSGLELAGTLSLTSAFRP